MKHELSGFPDIITDIRLLGAQRLVSSYFPHRFMKSLSHLTFMCLDVSVPGWDCHAGEGSAKVCRRIWRRPVNERELLLLLFERSKLSPTELDSNSLMVIS